MQVGTEGPFGAAVADGVLQLVHSLARKIGESCYLSVGDASLGKDVDKDGACIDGFFAVGVKDLFLACDLAYGVYSPVVELDNFGIHKQKTLDGC